MNVGATDLRRTPRRYPRFVLWLIYACEWGFRVVLRGKALYARQLAASLRVRIEKVIVSELPYGLAGLRIAHLSDFHAGPFLDVVSLMPVIDRLVELDPDVVVLTGDYLTHVADEGIALAPAFARVRPRHGGFLVFGNHDYRHRREGEMATAFARVGFRALRNQSAAIEIEGDRLLIAGIEDIEEGKVIDLDAALHERRSGDYTVLLAHHPDVARRVDGRGVDLLLSGHTHGGQFVVGGRSVFGASLRSEFGIGVHRLGKMILGVTSGIGVLMLPFRRNAPPEIVIYQLLRSS